MRRTVRAIWGWIDDNLVKVIVTLLFSIIIIVVLWPLSVVVIPSGHIGVLWSRFFGGTVTDKNYQEGTHVILPWDEMTIFDARLQLIERDYDVLTSDGLRSSVNIAVRFRLYENNIDVLQKYVGPDYVNVLLMPTVGAEARHIFARYRPETAFTEKRMEIESLILKAVDENLLQNFNPSTHENIRYLVIEDILIRGVQFPDAVAAAIERKSTEANRSQEYDFTIDAERKEAQRKEIEAEGIRRFQDIIKDGLTDNYLRWRGIEATLNLAQSQNSKVVIIGSGPNGLPIILGNTDDRPAPVQVGPMSTPNGPILPAPSTARTGARSSAMPTFDSSHSVALPASSQNAVSPSGPPTMGPSSPVLGAAAPRGPDNTAPPPAPNLQLKDSPILRVTPSQP